MNEVLRHVIKMFSFVLTTNHQLAQNVKMKILNEIQQRNWRKVVQQTNQWTWNNSLTKPNRKKQLMLMHNPMEMKQIKESRRYNLFYSTLRNKLIVKYISEHIALDPSQFEFDETNNMHDK